MKNQINPLSYNFLVFMQFLKRDLHTHRKHFRDYLINYGLLYPAIYAVTLAYLQTNTYFGSGNSRLGTILFAGNILVALMVITYKQTISLLFDLENDRFIDYQITILPPRLVIACRIFSTSLLAFVLALPFFPVAKLLVYSQLYTQNTVWWQLVVILYLASLCCSAYHQCATLILPSTRQITSLWSRVNHILINFGGFWIPLQTLYAFSPIVGTLAQANPLIYISEGLRQALIGGDQFLSFTICSIMLLAFTLFFTIIAWYQFQRRTDHL